MKLKVFESRESMPRSRSGMLLHLMLSVLLILGSAGGWFLIEAMTESRVLSCDERACKVVHQVGWFSAAKVQWQGKRPVQLLRHPQGRETGISIVDGEGETYRLTALGEGTRRAEQLEKDLGTLAGGLTYSLEDTGFGVEWIVAALILSLAAIFNLYSSVQMARRWAPPSPLPHRR